MSFEPDKAMEDAAADALIEAMCLYALVGWDRQMMIANINSSWTAATSLKPKSQNQED